MSSNPRIYVASLSDYNSGRLHGAWIDAAQDADVLLEEITAMLAKSREPVAEEWAIHDYDDMPNLGEWPSLEDVSAVAAAVEEHGFALVNGVIEHGGCAKSEVASFIEENYRGTYRDLADFAEEFTRDNSEIPEYLEHYIDWGKMARDFELGGDIFTIDVPDGVAVFWDH
jgi:antirestriction protein